MPIYVAKNKLNEEKVNGTFPRSQKNDRGKYAGKRCNE
jgi:hypothetical protein